MGVRVVHNPSLVHDIPSILMPRPVPWLQRIHTLYTLLLDLRYVLVYTILMRINVTIPDKLLKEIDSFCIDNNYDRSEFFRKLSREALGFEETLPINNTFVRPIRKENTGTIPTKTSTLPVDNTLPDMSDIEEVNAYGGQDGKDHEVVSMWCQLHFEAKKNYPCVKISYEDENGNELVHEKWGCPKCVASYENKGVGRVYYL